MVGCRQLQQQEKGLHQWRAVLDGLKDKTWARVAGRAAAAGMVETQHFRKAGAQSPRRVRAGDNNDREMDICHQVSHAHHLIFYIPSGALKTEQASNIKHLININM